MVDEVIPVKDEEIVLDDQQESGDDGYGEMSDEDFLKLSEPAVDPVIAAETPAEVAEVEQEDPGTSADPVVSDTPAAADPKADGAQPDAAGGEAAASDPKEIPAPVNPDAEKAPDYAELYNKIMAPFKANGREVKLQSPEEAIRLMQQGANYTQKMQQLAPNLKLMRMLQNNGLLDEQKLMHLIDLDQKNPAAITKFLRDAKVDPLDLDVSKDPAYTPGNHAVSDAEMAFTEALSNVAMTTTGKETIATINSSWDQASKDAIYREPALLQVIDEQRANGIYGQITAEIDRQRLLGNLPGISFIDAYKLVGDKLHSAGLLQPAGSQPVSQPQVAPAVVPAPTPSAVPAQPVVVDTRPAAPKPAPTTSDKARRMAPPPRTGSRTSAAAQLDPFNMTDEQIMSITSLKV